ncbi:MAG: ethanolamine ammonia-lyase subunit EutC [Sediminibacterium sp.]|nr:ethanolamine ammonia-lyase subunit EutC [Sediminibacterium sp.]
MMEEVEHRINPFEPKPLIARLNIGLVGVSQTTQAIQQFRLDHVLAQEAVLYEIPQPAYFIEHWVPQIQIPFIFLNTQASSKETYILQPELGRHLDADSLKNLQKFAAHHKQQYGFVVADGLSPGAIMQNGLNFFMELINLLRLKKMQVPAAIFIVRYGRVAVADEIGEILNATLSVIAIGERPGLRNLESMSVYITPAPKKSSTDADRTCISNIHAKGLSPQTAALKLMPWL